MPTLFPWCCANHTSLGPSSKEAQRQAFRLPEDFAVVSDLRGSAEWPPGDTPRGTPGSTPGGTPDGALSPEAAPGGSLSQGWGGSTQDLMQSMASIQHAFNLFVEDLVGGVPLTVVADSGTGLDCVVSISPDLAELHLHAGQQMKTLALAKLADVAPHDREGETCVTLAFADDSYVTFRLSSVREMEHLATGFRILRLAQSS